MVEYTDFLLKIKNQSNGKMLVGDSHKQLSFNKTTQFKSITTASKIGINLVVTMIVLSRLLK